MDRRASSPEDPPSQQPAPIPALVLVTADWAGPAKPASTVLRELSRRWGGAVHAVIIEDPEVETLDQLDVDAVPTWLLFEHAEAERSETGPSRPIAELRGITVTGEQIVLPGPWTLVHRRSGALPKHVVAEEFGPAGAADAS